MLDQSVAIIILAAGLALVILLASGMYIGLVLAGVGIILIVVFVGDKHLGMLGMIEYNYANSFVLAAMPLFIFMGYLILHSGLGENIVRAATSWVGVLPGGLLHSNIVASAIFSAISGSSVACAATIGSVAIPLEEKRGYDSKAVLGSLAAGGTLGNLIPPSISFIIYGMAVGESVGKLFMGGFLAGAVHAALFMVAILIWKKLCPTITPERERLSLRRMVASIRDVWPVAVLFLLVLGTIYLGVATPTEAAAFGASGALIFTALYRKLTWRVLRESLMRAAITATICTLIVVNARIMGDALSILRVPVYISELVVSMNVPHWGIYIFLVIMYVAMGCFLDPWAIILLTVPVVYPVMMSLGFDSVWFGVVLVILVELGLITPPVGVNLFVIQGVSGEPIGNVIKGVLPFIPCTITLVALLYWFPQIALFLPSLM